MSFRLAFYYYIGRHKQLQPKQANKKKAQRAKNDNTKNSTKWNNNEARCTQIPVLQLNGKYAAQIDGEMPFSFQFTSSTIHATSVVALQDYYKNNTWWFLLLLFVDLGVATNNNTDDVCFSARSSNNSSEFGVNWLSRMPFSLFYRQVNIFIGISAGSSAFDDNNIFKHLDNMAVYLC